MDASQFFASTCGGMDAGVSDARAVAGVLSAMQSKVGGVARTRTEGRYLLWPFKRK
jgi:hypothetical protein